MCQMRSSMLRCFAAFSMTPGTLLARRRRGVKILRRGRVLNVNNHIKPLAEPGRGREVLAAQAIEEKDGGTLSPVAYRASRHGTQVKHVERETSLPKRVVTGIRGRGSNGLNPVRWVDAVGSVAPLRESRTYGKVALMVEGPQLASHISPVLSFIGGIVGNMDIVRPDQ